MNLYFSLVSSLPLLKMTEAPLVSHEKFMSDCAGMIDAKKLKLLRRLSLVPGALPGRSSTRQRTAAAAASRITAARTLFLMPRTSSGSFQAA